MKNTDKILVNGLPSYLETHFEIVIAIGSHLNRGNVMPKPRVLIIQENQGTGGLYELAEELTSKFENKYKGKEWGIDDDIHFYDAIQEFIDEEFGGIE